MRKLLMLAIAGTIGATALAANQIVSSVAVLVYMAPLGMAGAVSIRIAQADGEGASHRVRAIGLAGILIVTAWMLAFTAVMYVWGEDIAALFIDKGVDDYVLKDQLGRLPLTVRRVLREQRLLEERPLPSPHSVPGPSVQYGMPMPGAVPAEQMLDFDAVVNLCEAFLKFNITSELHHIKTPTLLMVGEQDALKPRHYADIIAREMPQAEYVIVPGSGHALCWEKWQVFNSLVLGFLAKQGKEKS